MEKESFPGWVGSLTLFAARGCLVLQTSPELWPFGELGQETLRDRESRIQGWGGVWGGSFPAPSVTPCHMWPMSTWHPAGGTYLRNRRLN